MFGVSFAVIKLTELVSVATDADTSTQAMSQIMFTKRDFSLIYRLFCVDQSE